SSSTTRISSLANGSALPAGRVPTRRSGRLSTASIVSASPRSAEKHSLRVRFALAAALMLVVALATGARWPAGLRQISHVVVAACLVHGLYLGGVFVSIAGGMPAGTSAMLVGLQPILTVLLARAWLGERISARQWSGLMLGLAGVYLVVRHKVALD